MNRKKAIRQLLIGLCFTFLFACNSSTTSDKQVDKINEYSKTFFDEADLGAFGSDTKLFLNAEFSECGEWGGHKEKMVIYAKSDKEFYLSYQKYKVNCDSIGAYYGTPNFQKLELEKTFKLNDINKKSISDYIQRMAKSKIEERHPGQAGNSFSVFKSDSTLLINVYDNKEYDLKSYNRLITELKLIATTGQNK
jgi:hypothetical protein